MTTTAPTQSTTIDALAFVRIDIQSTTDSDVLAYIGTDAISYREEIPELKVIVLWDMSEWEALAVRLVGRDGTEAYAPINPLNTKYNSPCEIISYYLESEHWDGMLN